MSSFCETESSSDMTHCRVCSSNSTLRQKYFSALRHSAWHSSKVRFVYISTSKGPRKRLFSSLTNTASPSHRLSANHTSKKYFFNFNNYVIDINIFNAHNISRYIQYANLTSFNNVFSRFLNVRKFLMQLCNKIYKFFMQKLTESVPLRQVFSR